MKTKKIFLLMMIVVLALSISALAACDYIANEPVVEQESYTVTFDSDGGSDVSSQTVISGGTAIAPADPTKTGYAFAGWVDTDGELFSFATAITSDIVLTATWTEGGSVPDTTVYHTVKFCDDDGTVLSTQSVVDGSNAVSPEWPTKTGYTFAGWVDADGNAFDFSTVITNDMSLTASWTEDVVVTPDTTVYRTVEFCDEDSTVLYTQYVVDGGKAVAPADPTKTGHTFAGWVDADGNAFDFGTVVTNDLSLTASWTEDVVVTPDTTVYHTVEFCDQDGTILYTQSVVDGGRASSPTWPTKTGYTFAGWVDSNGDLFDFNTAITSYTVITATWTYNGDLAYTLLSDGTYSVTGIGTYTAQDLVIPTTYNDVAVTSIGNSAFSQCTSITSVTIPSSITSIGTYAFYKCTGLEYIYYNAELTASTSFVVGSYIRAPFMYSGNESECTLVIGDNVQYIPKYTFSYCYYLESVTIGSSVSYIAAAAFHNVADSLDGAVDVYYNGTLEDWFDIYFVEDESNPAYDGSYVYMLDDSNDYYLLTELVVPSTVVAVGDYQFIGFDAVTSITIPATVTSIGAKAFAYCANVETIYYSAEIASASYASLTYPFMRTGNTQLALTITENVEYLPEAMFCNVGWASVSTLTICNSAMSIGSGALYGTVGDWDVYYNGTLTDWLNMSFLSGANPAARAGCDVYMRDDSGEYYLLTELVIPSGVTTIGEYQFEGFAAITSVTFSSSVTTLSNRAFFYCYNLSTILYDDDCQLQIIGEYAYSCCYALSILDIPSSVNTIGSRAFYGCDGLISVTIPSSVTSIGETAFSYCTSLQIVFYNAEIATDENTASSFNISGSDTGCTLIIGNNVGYIPAYMFSGADFTSVTIGSGVSGIGERAFGSLEITSITIPSSVTSIDVDAFSYCYYLEYIYYYALIECDANSTEGSAVFVLSGQYASQCSLIIGNDVECIPAGIFGSSRITSVSFGSSVYTIGYEAFRFCSRLTTVTIPSTVTSIGDRAFNACYGLESIYYNAELPADTSDDIYSSGIFSDCGRDTAGCTLVIGDNVEFLPYSMCHGANIISLTIGSSVSKIAERAFQACSSLVSVTFVDTTSTWYYTYSSDYTGGTEIDVTDTAAVLEQVILQSYVNYWYKVQ